ncbi:MAG: InlB B-repeat-containing protein, partial [Acutalibacteraceae bacterium]|nr:InlB B-repeat-containing protein [Acutalibacteraceae bacterium]
EDATAEDDYNHLLSDVKNAFTGYGIYEHVFFEDLEHTFTIGENPDAGTGTVTKYAVTFLENDGTELSAKEYAANAAVVIPEEAENQLGWADTATGKLVDLEGYVATKKATFKRVLTTDEFDVVINLAGGTVDEAALPENAKIENGSLVVKAGLGEEVDLSTLPTPEKTGYTAEWVPATVTLDSINGASASVKWTAKNYTATFYNAKGDAEPIETVTVAYNGSASSRNTVAPEGMKFAGWADAATDEIVATSSVKYTFDEDKSFYAVWTAYDSSITIMVRDYEAGSGWKVGAVSYNDAGKTLNKTNTQALLAKAADSIDASIGTLPGTTMVYIYDNAETEGTLVDVASGLKYNGAATYYLCTTLDFNVTWKVPVFDAESGTFSGYTETTSEASTGAVANVYTVNVKTTADTTPPAGYTFKGWVLESTGEAVEYNANTGITLDSTFARDVAFVAEFAETEYEIVFDAQSGSADGKITIDKTFKKGDTVDLDGATFTNGFNKETVLPVVGVENSELEVPYIGKYGYKFTGWKLGTGANAVDVTFPIDELTHEMIEAYANGTTITVYGNWEALEYELRFFYATPETDMSKPEAERTYADPIVVKYKTGETINKNLDADTLALIEKNAPEGFYFLQWKKLDGSVVDSKMPAYGLDLYASYTEKRILIYVDYNVDKFDADGNKLELKDTMKTTPFLTQNPVLYGDDIEALGDAEAEIPMGVGTMVKRGIITDGDKPGENYEVVSWNTYHVEDGKDIYDKANWIPGINDEGTSNAYTTVIYQPEWKSHGDFFFRVYGTDGKIYMALGKNFKLYYWSNNYVSNRKDAAVNHDPENLVILLYKIAFEVEDGFTVRLDPIYAPKSMFTWDAFVGLMGALGNLIKGLV